MLLSQVCCTVIVVFKGVRCTLLCRLRNCEPSACMGILGSWRSVEGYVLLLQGERCRNVLFHDSL